MQDTQAKPTLSISSEDFLNDDVLNILKPISYDSSKISEVTLEEVRQDQNSKSSQVLAKSKIETVEIAGNGGAITYETEPKKSNEKL